MRLGPAGRPAEWQADRRFPEPFYGGRLAHELLIGLLMTENPTSAAVIGGETELLRLFARALDGRGLRMNEIASRVTGGFVVPRNGEAS